MSSNSRFAVRRTPVAVHARTLLVASGVEQTAADEISCRVDLCSRPATIAVKCVDQTDSNGTCDSSSRGKRHQQVTISVR